MYVNIINILRVNIVIIVDIYLYFHEFILNTHII